MPSSTGHAPNRIIRLADIAARMKMSRSGVSRALRNDSGIPLATCRRVQRVAKQMGFVADRQVSRAFQLVRMSGSNRIIGTLALLDAWPGAVDWLRRPDVYINRIYHSARERAAELGYRLEVFSLTAPGMSARRIQGILEARGVAGLLIPPLPPDVHELPIDWERYAAVALTHSLQRPELHRVSPHQFQAMSLALHNLHRCGYRRIGFMTWAALDVRVNHHFRAAYLSYQYDQPAANRLPILMAAHEFGEVFPVWYRQNRPDAIIGCDPGIVDLLDEHGLTDYDRLGFVSLGGDLQRPGHRLHGRLARVDQHSDQVGRAGVDFLIGQLDRRERGVPKVANVVMIEGDWIPGATVRSVQAGR